MTAQFVLFEKAAVCYLSFLEETLDLRLLIVAILLSCWTLAECICVLCAKILGPVAVLRLYRAPGAFFRDGLQIFHRFIIRLQQFIHSLHIIIPHETRHELILDFEFFVARDLR